MDYLILGPLEVRREGRIVALRGAQQRAVLAALLLRPNEVVSRDRLVEGLWSDRAPDTAEKMIQNAVSQLRKVLETNGSEPQVLLTRAPGYELRVDPDELDSLRFERLAAEGREALEADDVPRAAQLLRDALALWRGPALSDVLDTPVTRTEAARLDELRLSATEDWIDAELALGRDADLVAELEALVVEHPLRERLRAQQMLALYRAGRQADALAVYQRTRQLLVDELGIEPGPALQRLERAILQHDTALEPPQRPADGAAPRPAQRDVRKIVSVVFADVVFEGRALDPEALRPLTGRAVERVAQTLQAHGATVQTLVAGAVMGVFGVPTVHEDDALRAVRGALELGPALVGLSEEISRMWDVRLAFRAGVATGPVVAHSDVQAGVEGAPVNLAQALQREAAPGEVLIGGGTERLVRSGVRLTRSERGDTWRALEVLPHAEAVERRVDAPMVGRERELEHLRQAFDRASRERTAQLFTVLGAAGIGKSRLAREFVSSLGLRASVFSGRALPYGEGITFWPLAEVVRQAGEARSMAEILAHEDEPVTILNRVAAAIGLVEIAGTTEETFWAARKLFEALARERPLVLVFDDLHWAEPTFLDLLEHVAAWTRDAPIFLLCLARPELLDARPRWGGGLLNATSTLLEPLSANECRVLIDRLNATALDESVRVRIAEAADGNPLFVEQMIAIANEGDVDVIVPPTIQSLLAARLERLAPEERTALERASVIGREFWRGALADLAHAAGESADIDACLAALVRKDLVRPARTTFRGEEAFRFQHILIRETAYESVPKRERAQLHERFANWLERTIGERLIEVEEIVGYHLEQAHRLRAELEPESDALEALGTRAAARLENAGRRAYARGDLRGAVVLLTRASALLPEGTIDRLDLLTDLAEALREAGEFTRSAEVADEVLTGAEAAGAVALTAHARVIRLRLRLQADPRVDLARLRSEASEAVAVFEAAGDERRLAKAWELLAYASWFQCRAAETQQALERAIAHARTVGDGRTEAQGVNLSVGSMFFGPTPVAEAVHHCEEILGQPAAQRRTTASALRALAGLRAMGGKFDEARASAVLCRAILDDLGLRVTAASAAETYGIVEMLAGDPIAAEREFRAGYSELHEMGSSTAATLAALLAQSLYAQGRHAEALQYTLIAEERAVPADLSTQVQWRAARGKALSALDGDDEAERHARDAVALAREMDFFVVRADAERDLGEVLLVRQRRAEAKEAFMHALRLYEEKQDVVSAERTRALLAQVT